MKHQTPEWSTFDMSELSLALLAAIVVLLLIGNFYGIELHEMLGPVILGAGCR